MEAQKNTRSGPKFHQKRQRRSSFGNNVSNQKMIEIMSENNCDAHAVLEALASLLLNSGRSDPTICRELMLKLDDMNIRGAQLATASAFFNNDISQLVNAIRARDKTLVDFINANVNDRVDGYRFERAVTRGGSLR